MSTSLDQVDLDEVTSSEFDLPDLNHLPSLESILREDESCGTVDDDQSVILSELHTDVAESISLCSYDSKARSRIKNRTLTEKHGPILKRTLLRGISSQLVAANTSRIEAGIPTCLTCSPQFIAIGTSKGITLIFDSSQTMKWCLRLPPEEEVASVSALAISSDSKRILAGYSRGQLSLWDLKSGLLLHLSRDIQSALFAVLHTKFTSIDNVAIVSDSGGSMYQVVLKSNRKTLQHLCIFSGSNGEVLTLAPLMMNGQTNNILKPLAKLCVVAFATVTKLIVISLNPRMSIHFTYPLKSDDSHCPLISWFIPRNSEPMIAFARGCLINIYQVIPDSPKLNLSFLKNIQLGYSLQTMIWINPSVIILTDTQEQIHVMDFDVQEELETIDANDLQLVYGSAFFKGLATGGNVSEAMKFAGERACYYSMCPLMLIEGSLDRLFVLGMKSVIIYSIRSWDDRIDWFVKQYKYPEALSLSSSFYSGEARAIVGLPSNPDDRRKVVARKLIDLIKEFIDIGTTKLSPSQGSVDVLVEHYNEVIPICVEYSSSIGEESERLIKNMSEKFCNDFIAQSILFECLQENISNGRLCRLNTELTKDVIDYFVEKGKLLDVESIIIRLDIPCIDIHQCMTICRKYNLIDGIIHLHNQAFCDYISPLLEICERIQEKILKKGNLEDDDNDIGMKLLVYISCCLTGRAYPYGDIDKSERNRVRSDVINFITERDCKRIKMSTTYPNLRMLLNFDTSEFLNVLSLAFEFESTSDEDCTSFQEQNQKVTDTLLQVLVPGSEFSSSQVGSFYMFLAREVSKKGSSILVNRQLLEDIVEYLTSTKDDKKVEDRQQALLELAQSGKLDSKLMDKMLDRSLLVGFYRVCEYVYWEKKSFDKIFFCILQDEPRKNYIFSRIEQVLSSNSEASAIQKKIFLKTVLERVKDLCQIDSFKTAKLLMKRVSNDQELKVILKSLETDQEVLYKLLNCLLPDGLNHTSEINGRFKCLNEHTIIEKFIELMCIFDADSVVEFLSKSNSYRRNVVLDLCQNYRVHEGAAHLLEQDERFLEAFDLRFKRFCQIAKPSFGPHFLDTEIERLELELNKLIKFCERASEKTINDEDKQPLWFPLLEVVRSLLQFGSSDDVVRRLNHLTDMVFNEMIRFVSLIAILQWMLQDPSKAKLSDVKDLLMKAIDACNCEASLFRSTSHLLNADVYRQLQNFIRKSQKAIASKPKLTCDHCHYSIGNIPTSFVIFNCSHTFHRDCVKAANICLVCSKPVINGDSSADVPNHQLDNGHLDISFDHVSESQKEMLSRIESAFNSTHLTFSSSYSSSRATSHNASEVLNLTPSWSLYSSAMK